MPTPPPSPTRRGLFVFVVIVTAFSFALSSNVSSAAPYTSSSSSSSSPPTVESAHFSTRRATIVGRYGGTVVSENYQFLDVTFSEPMYARVDNLLCPASADASTGRASPRCAATSSDGGASCGNFTSSSSCLDSSSHTCLVAGQAPVRVSAEDYTWNFFSIAMPSCSSVLVYVRPISGDPDLFLSQTAAYPTYADYTWYSVMETNLAPEWYAFCCGTALYTSGDRLYAGVYAYTGTVYDIFIRDISDPLPITDFFPFSNMRLQCKRGSETYECETQNPDPAVTPCNIRQAFPAIDENYSRLASDSNPLVTDHDFEAVEGLWLGYQVISQTPITGGSTVFFSYNISSQCNASFTNLYPANATIFIDTNTNSSTKPVHDTFQFSPSDPQCEEAAFNRAAARINELGNLYNNVSSFGEFSKIQGAAKDYVTSDAWFGCMRLANNFLDIYSTTTVTETTTRCSRPQNDPEFDSDPCCNPQATFENNCVPGVQKYQARTYSPRKEAVEELCEEVPGCIYLSLSDYSRFRKREDDPTRSCASLTQDSINDLGAIPNLGLDFDCMARTSGVYCYGTSLNDCGQTNQVCSIFHRCTRSCVVDSDCADGQTCQWGFCETPYDNAEQIDLSTKCMVSLMDKPLDNYLRTLWNLSTSASIDTVHSVFRKELARDKCRGGPEIDDYAEADSASVCLSTKSCNWGACMVYPVSSADRSGCEAACLNKRPPFGPDTEDHFCGVCQSNYSDSCFEISEWEGCYVRDPDIFNLGCDAIGAFSNDIEFECVYNATQMPTVNACLDSTYCPYVREERGLYGSVRTVCDGYCYDQTLTSEFECLSECSPTHQNCWWTGTVCRVHDYMDAPSCLASGASWWATRVWKQGALQTQTECEAGYCYPHLGLYQAACEAKGYCTASCPANVGGACTNETECAQAGFCSDARELTHPDPTVDGVCVYSFKVDEAGLPGCPNYTFQGRKGCIDYTITNTSACLSLVLPYPGTTSWQRPARNQSECEAHGMGCYEIRYTRLYSFIGYPGDVFLSPKNSTSCTAVGGTPTPYYDWHSGTWVSGGKWQPLQWKQREWLSLNREVVQDFSYEEWYYALYPEAYVELYFPLLKSDQYCRYNRIIDVLSKIACSCKAPDASVGKTATITNASPCTLEPQILVGVSTLCTGFDFELDASPVGRLYIDKDVEITPKCVEGRVFSISSSQLQRNDPKFFFSDIYVRTLASLPSNYSIIENEHDVVVGQLIGDGAQFLFFDTRTVDKPSGAILNAYKGNITICLFKRPDIALEPRFNRFGFVAAAKDLSMFEIQSWKVWTRREGTDMLVCGQLPYPLPVSDRSAVFPIWYADEGWEDTTFYSSQPVETVFFFYFAVGLYALVLIANTIITSLLIIDYKEEVGRIRESLSDTRWHKAWRMFIDFFDMPRLIHFLIEIITIDRIVYFSMLPTGVLNDQPAVVYILLGEVPIYLFFSIYTALVSFWVELVHFRLGLKRSQRSIVKRIKMVFLGANIFMYCLLIALIIVFSILEHYAPSSMNTCEESGFLDGGDANDFQTARQVLFIFYQCVVVLMALAISLGFLVYGTRLVLVLYRTEAVNSKFSKLRRSKTIKFIVVMLVCTVSLVMLCGFLLYAAASETVDAIAAIVFIILAEILPLTLLTFSVGKSVPTLLSCCGRLDRNPTTSSSGKKEESRDPGREAEQQCGDGDQGGLGVVEMDHRDDNDDDTSEDDDDGQQVEMQPTRHEPKEDRVESDEVKM